MHACSHAHTSTIINLRAFCAQLRLKAYSFLGTGTFLFYFVFVIPLNPFTEDLSILSDAPLSTTACIGLSLFREAKLLRKGDTE